MASLSVQEGARTASEPVLAGQSVSFPLYYAPSGMPCIPSTRPVARASPSRQGKPAGLVPRVRVLDQLLSGLSSSLRFESSLGPSVHYDAGREHGHAFDTATLPKPLARRTARPRGGETPHRVSTRQHPCGVPASSAQSRGPSPRRERPASPAQSDTLEARLASDTRWQPDRSRVLLASGDVFEKALQRQFPTEGVSAPLVAAKGFRRWRGLPRRSEASWMQAPRDASCSPPPVACEPARPESAGRVLLREWTRATKLETSKDAARSSEHWLSALVHPDACRRSGAVLQLSWQDEDDSERVLAALSARLDDASPLVRRAAALGLLARGQASPAMAAVLRESLQQSAGWERCVLAKSLAAMHVADADVVESLVDEYLARDDDAPPALLTALLVSLSAQTGLVAALLAEGLHSKSWARRRRGCQLVSQLKSAVTRDLSDQLIALLWDDWQHDVRHAAAQALHDLGLGQLVHDHLVHALAQPGKDRDLALAHVRQLGLATDKMALALEQCMHDPRQHVRQESCLLAAHMATSPLRHPLTRLAQHDPSWQVKHAALQALHRFPPHDELRRLLLWTLRFDTSTQLRVHVAHMLEAHGQHSVVAALHQQLSVEHEAQVKDAIQRSLAAMTDSAADEDVQDAKVKDSVRQMARKEAIVGTLLRHEGRVKADANRQHMLFHEDDAAQRRLQRQPQAALRVGRAASTRGGSPGPGWTQ